MNDLLTRPIPEADAPPEGRTTDDLSSDFTFESPEVGTSGFFPHVDTGDDSEA